MDVVDKNTDIPTFCNCISMNVPTKMSVPTCIIPKTHSSCNGDVSDYYFHDHHSTGASLAKNNPSGCPPNLNNVRGGVSVVKSLR